MKGTYRRLTSNCIHCLLVVAAIQLVACHNGKTPAISFYYWKTAFDIGDMERKALTENEVSRLYVRYFDVSMENGEPAPIGTLRVDSFPAGITIIPVVFIKNEVFKQPQDSLAIQVQQLITAINNKTGISPQEVQFDCDWTETTKDAYFSFLRTFKKNSGMALSATIRLHQLKYRTRSGIPPADRGVLMYYNMGKIGGAANSVYDKETAARYTGFLRSYPLPLDVALPIFSWSLLLRNGRVTGLLNKTDKAFFDKDTNFTRIRDGRYRVKHSLFKGGYYLRSGDEVNVEQVEKDLLLAMMEDLEGRLDSTPHELIFYDLDAPNIERYEETIFKELAAGFR